jgi:hypothetical protein
MSPATVTLRRMNLMFFFQWCIDSGMQLNLKKCKTMSFTRSRFTRHFQYVLSGHRLDSVDSICNLGVVFDSKLNFTLHIDSLIVKARRLGCWVTLEGLVKSSGICILLKHYIILTFGLIWITQASCGARTTACI